MDIKKVAIIGGGTAGWLAANHLGKALCNKDDISITLIESPDVPPIGVGEGTVPDIKKTLLSFGISETDFIRECDATFKQSIKFVNWMDKKEHGENNFFHHLFDVPLRNEANLLTSHWLSEKKDVCCYAEMLSSQHKICEEGLAPKSITTPEYQGDLAYAYHLNAAKFAKLLASNAKSKYFVKHLLANITGVNLSEDGSIFSLTTDSQGELEFDFYIDCSGFDSILINKALKVPFKDVSKTLLVNRALVVQVPTAADAEIPPYTVATAHQAGWIWDIALSSRRGVGLVYSSSHMSDEEAEEKLDNYLGESKQNLTYRTIPMKIGYREKFWHKNCVALGLAQGFLEPLEATSILLTDFSAEILAQRFPSSTAQLAQLEKRFNHSMVYAWDRVVDFIKLHYCISDRTDSEFWVDNKKSATIPMSLQEKLALWESYIPISDDFFSHFEVFFLENFLFVLYGMGFKTKLKNDRLPVCKTSLAMINQRKEITNHLQKMLPRHRDLLDKIKQFGLQSL
ncbi:MULTISPECIES: tryptophan halogenase family protein [Pseudoalteromonas]|uniref:Tryptophan halogenase n=1 Tax=Pseudoalteromonas porphyrae TaxID=187330 RepID=A0A0N1MU88_9GAMM|nr:MULTISPECIES: tryptophan halogenase family protein [Pseudoalteromonas]KPH63250.1 tryptophan halogenase [Pseudoalteromonas porphyrae]